MFFLTSQNGGKNMKSKLFFMTAFLLAALTCSQNDNAINNDSNMVINPRMAGFVGNSLNRVSNNDWDNEVEPSDQVLNTPLPHPIILHPWGRN
jgi:hypothetical protein